MELQEVRIEPPEDAFHQGFRSVKVKVGDYAGKVYDLIGDTRPEFINQTPILKPSTVHISGLRCTHREFKLTNITTIHINKHEKITAIRVRKPFESEGRG